MAELSCDETASVLNPGRKLFYDGVLVAISLSLIEAFSYVIGSYMADHYGLLYKEQRDLAHYSEYLRYREPMLGWPSARHTKDRDETGSRINPTYPDPKSSPSCISLYGDSFTYAAEVDNEHAWSNLLSQLGRCRVANYAVGGYGTDQAYLRFKSNQNDEARTVILGIFSENIMRNVNQYRNLFYPARYGLKPRFILDQSGELELVPLPEINPEDYLAFVEDPNCFLPHEFFRLNGPYGPTRLRFPYTISFLRALRHFRVVAGLTGRPHWAAFYEENHPSGSLQLTERIAVAFRDLAAARGKRALVVIIPHPMDVRYFVKTGSWTYENLLARLRKDGVDSVNVGVGMIDYLRGRSPYELAGVQHYNAEGYKVIAEVVHAHLEKHPQGSPVDSGSSNEAKSGFVIPVTANPDAGLVGVDIAFRWLVVAKKRLAEAGLDLPLLCACAEALPFPDGTFDRVAADSVLEEAAG